MNTNHEASCPDIAPKECAEQDIPTHNHNQSLLYVNWNHTLIYMLPSDWQIGIVVPLQMRQIQIEYLLEDGSEFLPPYAGRHHRNENLLGIGDPQIFARSIVWLQSWGLMPELRISLPVGKIEDNPYLLAQESQAHQPLQMGNLLATIKTLAHFEVYLEFYVKNSSG